MAEVVEHLPIKCEVLSSNPKTAKKKVFCYSKRVGHCFHGKVAPSLSSSGQSAAVPALQGTFQETRPWKVCSLVMSHSGGLYNAAHKLLRYMALSSRMEVIKF
jgi:hypothetical protein